MTNFFFIIFQLLKSQKNRFFGPEKFQNWSKWPWHRGQNFTQKNLDFGGYQPLFGADTTRKYEPVFSQNNAQTILKKLWKQSKFAAKIRLTHLHALQTISIILFLINFYQKARSNKTETYRRHLTFIFRGLKLVFVFSHQNAQLLIWNLSMEKKLFFEKIFHGRISNQICGFWWENTTNIMEPLKIRVKCLR